MSTPETEREAAPPPARPRRARGLCGALVRGGLAGVALAVGLETARVLVGGNFHAVIPGRVYRTGQPSPERLARLVERYQIRTVLNLRGCCAPFAWYLAEARATHAADVAQEDVCLSAGRLPSAAEVRRLVEVLDHTEYPILLHCARGADRTGLVAAVVLLLHTEAGLGEAARQLGPRYGHVALGRAAYLDRFLELYRAWLRREGRQHTRAHFRSWLVRHYQPDGQSARLSLVGPPDWSGGRPGVAWVRVENTSARPWRFCRDKNAGLHLNYVLHDAGYRALYADRAGLFDAVLLPGQYLELPLALPPPPRPGRYRLWVDVIDEQQNCFFQTGSEPLEEEVEAHE
jgi:hypothetical protein